MPLFPRGSPLLEFERRHLGIPPKGPVIPSKRSFLFYAFFTTLKPGCARDRISPSPVEVRRQEGSSFTSRLYQEPASQARAELRKAPIYCDRAEDWLSPASTR